MVFTGILFSMQNSHQMWPQLFNQQKSACLEHFYCECHQNKKFIFSSGLLTILCNDFFTDLIGLIDSTMNCDYLKKKCNTYFCWYYFICI